MTDEQQPATPRRTVLQGAAAAGAVGLGLAGLASCAPKPARPSGPTDLGKAEQVPVGGATLFRNDRVVVAQPAEGSYRAFSAVCTHQGCVVDSLVHDVVSCPCHGSRFNALTGAVERGPAAKPLPEVRVEVKDGKLVADL